MKIRLTTKNRKICRNSEPARCFSATKGKGTLVAAVAKNLIARVGLAPRAQKKLAPRSNPMEVMVSDATNPTTQNRTINANGWGAT